MWQLLRMRSMFVRGYNNNQNRTIVGRIPQRQQSSQSSSVQDHNRQYIAATRKWFESIVIGEKLCPFAPPLLLEHEKLRIVCSNASDSTEAVNFVAKEVRDLFLDDALHETTLVVMNSPFVSSNFRDFVRLSWELQQEAVGEDNVDKLQLVLFHPLATHETYGEQEESAGDYTIRSPYPTVHLLREQDVMKAVQGNYPNVEAIPRRNKSRMAQQGLDVCKQRLADCFQDTR